MGRFERLERGSLLRWHAGIAVHGSPPPVSVDEGQAPPSIITRTQQSRLDGDRRASCPSCYSCTTRDSLLFCSNLSAAALASSHISTPQRSWLLEMSRCTIEHAHQPPAWFGPAAAVCRAWCHLLGLQRSHQRGSSVHDMSLLSD